MSLSTAPPTHSTSTSTIIERTVPINSLWKRATGKHAGRTVQVTRASNRGVRIELIGNQYANSHPKANSPQFMAHVPYDMFTKLYKPEDSSIRQPTEVDVHLWHIETKQKCNCNSRIQQLAQNRIKITAEPMLKLKSKSTPTPTPKATTATATVRKSPEEDTMVTQSKPVTPKTRGEPHWLLPDNASVPELESAFVAEYSKLWGDPSTPSDWRLTVLKKFKLNAATGSEILKRHGFNPSTKERELMAAKRAAMKNTNTKPKLPVPVLASVPVEAPELQLQPVPTFATPTSLPVPQLTVTSNVMPQPAPVPVPMIRRWHVTVIREVVIEVEAPSLLDALAQADADPLNSEVVGVERIRASK